MVNSSHEAMHRIFQEYPGLFTGVSKVLGLPFIPPTSVTVLPTDLTEGLPEAVADPIIEFTAQGLDRPARRRPVTGDGDAARERGTAS
ncbi:hypothetical protein ACH4UM_03205 [Streptomyces sp. NPDC020801]|uniref:hypothetical protein n=1 Tax=unclassified Streptomyces TaxID=2593676 RepID=UPI0037A241E9